MHKCVQRKSWSVEWKRRSFEQSFERWGWKNRLGLESASYCFARELDPHSIDSKEPWNRDGTFLLLCWKLMSALGALIDPTKHNLSNSHNFP